MSTYVVGAVPSHQHPIRSASSVCCVGESDFPPPLPWCNGVRTYRATDYCTPADIYAHFDAKSDVHAAPAPTPTAMGNNSTGTSADPDGNGNATRTECCSPADLYLHFDAQSGGVHAARAPPSTEEGSSPKGAGAGAGVSATHPDGNGNATRTECCSLADLYVHFDAQSGGVHAARAPPSTEEGSSPKGAGAGVSATHPDENGNATTPELPSPSQLSVAEVLAHFGAFRSPA